VLHDKATASQPLGRCLDSPGGGRGGARSPLPVLATEPPSDPVDTRPASSPLPPPSPPEPLPPGGLSEGRKAAAPRKRGVLGAAGGSGFAPGPRVESDHGLRGGLLEGLLGVLWGSLAPLRRKSEELHRQQDPSAALSAGALCLAPAVSRHPAKGRRGLPRDSNHHRAFQFLIGQHSTLWLQKAIIAACTSVISRSLLMSGKSSLGHENTFCAFTQRVGCLLGWVFCSSEG